jgi:hypothetical protein
VGILRWYRSQQLPTVFVSRTFARSSILLAPPVRNIDAAREPDVRMRARVSHEIAKDLGAIRAARQEWVHGNAHDLRVDRAFLVKIVELINQQAVEVPSAV